MIAARIVNADNADKTSTILFVGGAGSRCVIISPVKVHAPTPAKTVSSRLNKNTG